MTSTAYDVIVVGAGCAGLTAAVALARAGFSVAVVETAHAGSGNATSGVYFAENLAHADVLGEEGAAALPWERRLVERGRFITDGAAILGVTYRDPAAFRNCYTVLRSTLDRRLAELAQQKGATLICDTPVESLIREAGRVIGVCTPRGPLYAGLVFLAEGDSAHLLSREGCERSTDPRDAPRFLLGMQLVVELPSGAIEERFGVGPEEGVAYELLLRNGCLEGQEAPLNLRAQLSTDRQGLTLGMVVSLDALRRHGASNPLGLLGSLAAAPALAAWLGGGRRGAATVRLLRGGGVRDMPHLVADGLAVGGAAAGLGVTFPFLNFTGPATASGLLLAQAAVRIRASGGGFTSEALGREYVAPLLATHYGRDLEYLRRWPGFIRKAERFFGRDVGLVLESAQVWTRPQRWLPGRAVEWVRVLGRWGGWGLWGELRDDMRLLGWALRSRRVAGRPAVGRLLLDGALNALRDLGRRGRLDVPPAGRLEVHYRSGAKEGDAAPPRFLQRWLSRARPILAAAIAGVVRNDRMPLAEKLTGAIRLLVRQINLLDLLVVAALGVLTALAAGIAGWRRRREASKQIRWEKGPDTFSEKVSGPFSLHVLWPRRLPVDDSLPREGLERVCPANVFETSGPADVRLHVERCVACEACWRASRVVDCGRGELDAVVNGGASPRTMLLDRIEDKLYAFDAALRDLPATLDRAAADHLEMLARYARQQILEFAERVHADAAGAELLRLTDDLASKAEERMRRTWDGRFAWAAADGRQLRWHHLARLRGLLSAERAAGADDKSQETGDTRPTEDTLSRSRVSGLVSSAPHSGSLVGIAADLTGRLCRDLRHKADLEGPGTDGTRVLLAGTAAAGALLHTLDARPPAEFRRAEANLRTALFEALAIETLDTLVHATAGLQAGAEEFCREAGRVLAQQQAPGRAFRRYARRLLDGWQKARTLLRVDGDFDGLAQRRALLPELEEVQRAEGRLGLLAETWQAAGRGDPELASLDAEIAEGIGRQESHLAACRLLLLATHARLETLPDAEVEMALLRVVFDDVAADLEHLAAVVERRLEPASHYRQRPLVEPDLGPLPRSLTEYLAGPEPFQTGDFLLAAVDLIRPRWTPEMLGDKPLSVDNALENCLGKLRTLLEACQAVQPSRRRSQAEGERALAVAWRVLRLEEDVFVGEALTCALAGLAAHPAAGATALEQACTRFVLERLVRHASRLAADVLPKGDGAEAPVTSHTPSATDSGTSFASQRMAVIGHLRTMVSVRRPGAGAGAAMRHVGPEALALEALKTDVRRQTEVVLEMLGGPHGTEPGLRLLGLALAGSVAWLWAADCVLGRLAWIARARMAEAPDDPSPLPPAGRRAFARCLDEARTRLRRLEEDLSALGRGYWPPQARAAALLLGLPGQRFFEEKRQSLVSQNAGHNVQ
jgi:electron transfer flavoprotein-quinone oxidoreductase